MGQKTTFLVQLPYIFNRLEFSAHILTQGRSWAELVPLDRLVDFWLEGFIFGAKTTFLVHLFLSLEPLGIQCSILIQDKS